MPSIEKAALARAYDGDSGNGKVIGENRLGTVAFAEIDGNIYLKPKDKKSATRKKKKKNETLVCECTYTGDPEDHCGELCLNRHMFIECDPESCPLGKHCRNQRFQRKEYANTEVIQTEKKGMGLVTREDLDANAFILEYVGEVIDHLEFQKRVLKYHEEQLPHFYFMTLNNEQIIDATKKGGTARFLNHSCDPNAVTQKWMVNGRLRIGLFTTRTVKNGDELCFDYQFERYGSEAQKCYCGSSNCRGIIGGEETKEVGGIRTKTGVGSRGGRKYQGEYELLPFDDKIAQIVNESHAISTKENMQRFARLLCQTTLADELSTLLPILENTLDAMHTGSDRNGGAHKTEGTMSASSKSKTQKKSVIADDDEDSDSEELGTREEDQEQDGASDGAEDPLNTSGISPSLAESLMFEFFKTKQALTTLAIWLSNMEGELKMVESHAATTSGTTASAGGSKDDLKDESASGTEPKTEAKEEDDEDLEEDDVLPVVPDDIAFYLYMLKVLNKMVFPNRNIVTSTNLYKVVGCIAKILDKNGQMIPASEKIKKEEETARAVEDTLTSKGDHEKQEDTIENLRDTARTLYEKWEKLTQEFRIPKKTKVDDSMDVDGEEEEDDEIPLDRNAGNFTDRSDSRGRDNFRSGGDRDGERSSPGASRKSGGGGDGRSPMSEDIRDRDRDRDRDRERGRERSRDDSPLPEPWQVAHDADGRPYYWNPDTRETSWNRPHNGNGGRDRDRSRDDRRDHDRSRDRDKDRRGGGAYHHPSTIASQQLASGHGRMDYADEEDEEERKKRAFVIDPTRVLRQAQGQPIQDPDADQRLPDAKRRKRRSMSGGGGGGKSREYGYAVLTAGTSSKQQNGGGGRLSSLSKEVSKSRSSGGGGVSGGGGDEDAVRRLLSSEPRAGKFKESVSQEVIRYLSKYRKETCITGRIESKEDFKFLARKMTHMIVLKEHKKAESKASADREYKHSWGFEAKHKGNVHKFITDYMAKFGEVYVPKRR
eukprot:Clim_evm8s220 gene=Clim_evmTU8s220